MLYGFYRDPSKTVPEAPPDTQVDEDAFLRMREEYLHVKRKQQEDYQTMRECALELSCQPC